MASKLKVASVIPELCGRENMTTSIVVRREKPTTQALTVSAPPAQRVRLIVWVIVRARTRTNVCNSRGVLGAEELLFEFGVIFVRESLNHGKHYRR